MLVQKIRKHMMEMPYIDGRGRVYKYGEFFPVEFSPYGYNETIAIEHMPLTQEQAKGAGFHWKAIEKKQHTVTLVNNAIPDRVSDTDASITKEIIGCAHAGICEHGCSGAFKVIASEFAFLKAHDIALPRLCPNCRHRERIAQRNPMTIFERICQCAGVGSESGIYKNNAHHSHGEVHCPERFKTVFNPIRPDIIYCESCYQQEVV